MEVGFVGLGKMGANMVLRLLGGGHRVVGYSLQYDPSLGIEEAGGEVVSSLEVMIERLATPRVIWLMVPAGEAVDATIDLLLPKLSPGDILVDGGNSLYKDSVRRWERLREHKIEFVDCGTSGGVWGLKQGYCLMVGASQEAFARIEPLLKTLAPENGYLHAGPSGAGHYAKMIHNGIEYGLMQAYAEGFDVLANAPYDFDLAKLTNLWNQGAVIRSWLLELVGRMFVDDPKLEQLEGYVRDSGSGRWTVQEALDRDVPTPAITAALQVRIRSRRENTFSDRFLAALRNQFGGHDVKKR